MCPVLNISGFWISRVTQGLPIFVNIRGLWICFRMQLLKGSEYSRNPNMPGSCISNDYTRLWIWLNNAWINSSDYGSVLNMPGQSLYVNMSPFLNMPGLKICQNREYARVTHKPGYAFDNAEYVWICLHIPE